MPERRQGLRRSAGAVATLTGVASALALLREVAVISFFRSADGVDAYYIGLTVVHIVGSLVSSGMAGSIFLPLLDEQRAQRVESSVQVESQVLGFAAIAGAVASIATIGVGLAYGYGVQAIAGLPFDADGGRLVVLYSAPAAGLLWFAGSSSALANRHGRFVGPSLGNVAFAAISLLWLAAVVSLGWPLTLAAVGLTLGAGANAAISAYSWSKGVGRFVIAVPGSDLIGPVISRSIRLWSVVGIGHLGLAGERAVAAFLPPGAVALVSVGRRIAASAANIGGDAIATVLFPVQSRASAVTGRIPSVRWGIVSMAVVVAASLSLGAIVTLTVAMELSWVPEWNVQALIGFVPLAAGLSWQGIEFRRTQALSSVMPAAVVAVIVTGLSLMSAGFAALLWGSIWTFGVALAVGPVTGAVLGRRFGRSEAPPGTTGVLMDV